MSALAPILPSLSKLIPMLATDRDGELVAAVRAIRRTLKSAGLDLQHVVEALEKPERIIVVYGGSEPESGSPRDILRWLRDEGGAFLSGREIEFVQSLATWIAVGRQPTEKQSAWLHAIYLRARKEYVG